MTNTQDTTITAVERVLAVLLTEGGVRHPGRRATDAVSLVIRHSLRPTAARPAVPVAWSVGIRDASIARRGAEHVRRRLAARSQGDG
ncbi:hypothetical protein [Nonomuraea sp. NPDC001831]|uniref:hypothetical protein n=1 Tax=Nonomuraea sp. NPDC001831 TaxID=3364340 RepID=UPI0036C2979B